MSSISAATVKALRDRTDMPMMDCKAALAEAGGDVEKAVLILRTKGKKFSEKKGDRETAEGRIGTFADQAAKVAAIVEVRCETPSVIKNDKFVALSTDLARQVAYKNPASVEELVAQPFIDDPTRTVQDRINDVIGLIRENMKVSRFERVEGIAGEYTHHDGSLGVLVVVSGQDSANPETLRDIAAHIAALNPSYAKADDVPAEVRAREQELAKVQAAERAAGKPANVAEKIAEGIYKTWLSENVLLEQPVANAVKYDKKTVGQVLKSLKVELVKPIRFKVGG